MTGGDGGGVRKGESATDDSRRRTTAGDDCGLRFSCEESAHSKSQRYGQRGKVELEAESCAFFSPAAQEATACGCAVRVRGRARTIV